MPDFDAHVPPCFEALLMGTLALMTCWASAAGSERPKVEQERELMARRIAGKLLELQHHAALSAAMRPALAQFSDSWLEVSRAVLPALPAGADAGVLLH